MEPADDGWRNEMKKYLCSIERLAETALKRIKLDRIQNNIPFDGSFKAYFLRETNAR